MCSFREKVLFLRYVVCALFCTEVYIFFILIFTVLYSEPWDRSTPWGKDAMFEPRTDAAERFNITNLAHLNFIQTLYL